MDEFVFVQLLDEGTIVYRPVPSRRIKGNLFELGGFDKYDSEDEHWEFLPGSFVIVEEKEWRGKKSLGAVREDIK